MRVPDQSVLSGRSFAEKARIPPTDPSVRLACQCFVHGDCEVRTFPRVRQGWMEHKVYQHLIED